MQERLPGIILSWLTENQNDIFPSISSWHKLLDDRFSNLQISNPGAQAMIQIFLDKCGIVNIKENFPPRDINSFIAFLCDIDNSIYRKFAIIYFLIDEFVNITQTRTIEDVYDFANLIRVSTNQVQFILGCIDLDSIVNEPDLLLPRLTVSSLPHSLEFPILTLLLSDPKLYPFAFMFYVNKKPNVEKDLIDHHYLIIKTLVLNSRLYESLLQIRTIRNEESIKECLQFLFDFSLNNKKETELFNTVLTRQEEDIIFQFAFPSEKCYNRFCLARRRFDKAPEEIQNAFRYTDDPDEL